LRKIDGALVKISDTNLSADTKEELAFIVVEAKRNILAWKAHLLRSINQDEARLDEKLLTRHRSFLSRTGQ
jgi:hypothetical protein